MGEGSRTSVLRATVRMAACSLLCLPALLGCRGSLGPPLAEWRAQADEICKQVQDEADKTRPVLFEQSLAQTLRKSADYSKEEAKQLRAIDKPSEQRDAVREYLNALDDRNRELDLVANQAEHPGPDFEPPSLERLAIDTTRASDFGKQLDMKHCRAGIDVSIGGSDAPPPTTASRDPNAPPPPNPTDLDNETIDQPG